MSDVPSHHGNDAVARGRDRELFILPVRGLDCGAYQVRAVDGASLFSVMPARRHHRGIEIEDADGRVRAVLRERIGRFRDRMVIELPGHSDVILQRVSTLEGHEEWELDVHASLTYFVNGDVAGHEYSVRDESRVVAEVCRGPCRNAKRYFVFAERCPELMLLMSCIIGLDDICR